MSKKSIIFVLILLVVLSAGVYLFIQQKPDVSTVLRSQVDTSGWETYYNDQFGYRLVYPKKSVLRAGTVNTILLVDDLLGVPQGLRDTLKGAELSKDGYFLDTVIAVHNLPNPDNLGITDWMSINRADIIKSADLQKDITFADVPALLLEREDRGINGGMYAYHESTMYFFRNGNLYSIRSIAPPENPTEEWRSHPYYQYLEQSVPITQAIIDSFRFVE